MLTLWQPNAITEWLPSDEGVGAVVVVHLLIYLGGAVAVTLQHRVAAPLGTALFAACVLPGPFLLPTGERVQRSLTCFTSGFYFCRMLQLSGRTARRRPLWLKLSHTFLTFMDTAGAHGDGTAAPTAGERAKAAGQIGVAVLNLLVVAAAGLTASAQLQAGSTDLEIAAAVLLGGVCALAGLTAFGDMLCGVWMLAARLRLPALMRNPMMSLSLREFWGRRWNSVIQTTLKQYIFLRVSRGCGGGRRWNGVAAAATFLCSGFIHAYPVFVAHNCSLGRPVLLVLSYFVMLGLATCLQQAVCVPRKLLSASASASVERASTRLRMRWLTLFSVILPSPVLVAVMMTLPLAPGSTRLMHLEERLQSLAFARTWAGLAVTVSLLLAVCGEALLWSGFGAEFFHYQEQRRNFVSYTKKEKEAEEFY